MLELQKTSLKVSLYNKNDFILFTDSYTNEVINPDFQAIDAGLYERLQQKPKVYTDYTGRNINALMQGQKISIGTI